MFIFKGVVVVEDIKRAKAILKEPNTTVEQMIECLSGLEKKIPSRKVLLETKIGKIVLALLRLYKSNPIKIKSYMPNWLYCSVKDLNALRIKMKGTGFIVTRMITLLLYTYMHVCLINTDVHMNFFNIFYLKPNALHLKNQFVTFQRSTSNLD